MTKRRLLALSVLGILVSAIYVGWRYHSDASAMQSPSNVGNASVRTTKASDLHGESPPPSASKKPSGHGTLNASPLSPARGDDQQTAITAFRSMRECHVASARIRNMQANIDACNRAAAITHGYDNTCAQEIRVLGEKILAANAELSACSPVSAEREKAYFDTTVRAAKLGDPDAQICYIRGVFAIDSSQMDREQHKDTAMAYVQDALSRGDWRVVKLLGATENYLAHAGGLMSELPIGSAYDVYRMNRLLRLGASGEYGEQLDLLAKSPAAKLTDKERVDAFSWALQEYKEHFANAPELQSEPDACQDSEVAKQ